MRYYVSHYDRKRAMKIVLKVRRALNFKARCEYAGFIDMAPATNDLASCVNRIEQLEKRGRW